jgi:hypothetical protein
VAVFRPGVLPILQTLDTNSVQPLEWLPPLPPINHLCIDNLSSLAYTHTNGKQAGKKGALGGRLTYLSLELRERRGEEGEERLAEVVGESSRNASPSLEFLEIETSMDTVSPLSAPTSATHLTFACLSALDHSRQPTLTHPLPRLPPRPHPLPPADASPAHAANLHVAKEKARLRYGAELIKARLVRNAGRGVVKCMAIALCTPTPHPPPEPTGDR